MVLSPGTSMYLNGSDTDCNPKNCPMNTTLKCCSGNPKYAYIKRSPTLVFFCPFETVRALPFIRLTIFTVSAIVISY